MEPEMMKPMTAHMQKTIESLQKELARVRTGRASPGLVDGIQVEYYGSKVPINQVANIATPDAKTIQIVPWEPSSLQAIEKSIMAANLGFNPQSDGKVIRIPMPSLTEERRKEMVKSIKKMGEDAKVAVRNHRRDANEVLKKQEKDKVLSQDEVKKALELVQKRTDEKIKDIDRIIESKEKEILTV